MKLLKNILFATDFSKSSKNALKMAIEVAKTLNSRIFLLHVIENGHLPRLTLEMVKTAANAELNTIESAVSRAGIEVAQKFVICGVPFDQIIRYADFYDVNLIVMGAGEHSRSDSFPLGLTAQKTVRKANKPVLVVKDPPAADGLKRIVCPVDFSEPSERALKNAIHLARNFNAELKVLHVVEPLSGGMVGEIALEADQQSHFDEQQHGFNEFLKNFDFYHVKWQSLLKTGSAFITILETLESEKPDLLIMGSTGRTGLSRFLLGSVAEKVTRQLPCSFIVEKEEEPIRVEMEARKNDLRELYEEGNELLEREFLDEAIEEFQRCLNIDVNFEPAWTAMAIAYERLGDMKNAGNCLKRAQQIREMRWEEKVQAEIRSKHSIFGRETKHF